MSRVAGIIGGIAPESTIGYYRRIIAACRERTGDGSYPAIVVNSIDMTTMLRLAANDRDVLVAYLAGEVERLDGVVLAGTELPLLLRGVGVEGLEMLDTTALHVEAIVERMFG